ncbi:MULTISPECIES: hypothetical protein [Tsukamurella]|uniref:Uncharacterized protein n=1 Tax=Tsukamurella strandjordii TaxID=147577 RepID=A0AA90NKD6_9ACTN|nr:MULTISPECIES: hypothetical protein [Tsukamurella]MDP0400061.1 hypothetical protein [Tsukamurella strandjordii]GIZ97078.1 hypothetical protein TTY48_16900 [Tsukamurella sp. TY48]
MKQHRRPVNLGTRTIYRLRNLRKRSLLAEDGERLVTPAELRLLGVG